MSTERRFPAHRLAAGAALAAALAAGLVLLALAVPRAAAYGLIADRGGAAALQPALSPQALEAARGRYREALSWHPSDGGLALDLARLDLRAPAGEGEALSAAVAHLRQAAARTPNNALVWSLLAEAETKRAADPEAVVEALRMSRFTGRFEASSLVLRSSVALTGWSWLPDDLRDNARRDLARLAGEPRLRRDMIRMYVALGYGARAVLLDQAFAADGDRERFKRQVLSRAGERRDLRPQGDS
ncbi:MAG: hypothetical protein RH982_16605 [Parvibaculum sp.]